MMNYRERLKMDNFGKRCLRRDFLRNVVIGITIFSFLLIGLAELSPALNAQTTSGLEIEGWAIVGKIAVYSPKTLADYIGDAAELYLNYDFRELTVAEYRNADSATVVVEIYRHGSPRSAFGIYSQERPAKGN